VSAELVVDRPTYVVAVADGGAHPRSLFTHVYAHTSPVYVDVDHRRVVRAEDVAFCLRWLDLLEGEEQLAAYRALIEEARRVYQSRVA
jgi:hypothetical protein